MFEGTARRSFELDADPPTMLPSYNRFVPYLATLLFSATRLAATEPSHSDTHSSITSTRLQEHVEVLADDSFEGREAGTRGGRAAAGYLVQCLQKWGLAPAGENASYFQNFDHGFRNVLAEIRADAAPHESGTIVVCGHYDHVGLGNRSNSYGPIGLIHNGADDNASGVAGLLELARYLAKLRSSLKKSVLFIFWDGEERGLLGSRYWLEHPTVALNQVDLVINVDMIGRLRKKRLEVLGTRTAFHLRQFVTRQNRISQLEIDFIWKLTANSDHYPFIEHGIPAMMFHTGLHEDYHRPSDETHLLNIAGLEQVTRLLRRIVWRACQHESGFQYRDAWREETDSSRQALESESLAPPPRLGVQWDAGDTSFGLRLISVTRDLPASRAGLQSQDLIVALNGRQITDSAHFQHSILTHAVPIVLSVQRPAEPEVYEMTIKLTGKPQPFGITWREDPAEPGIAIVTRVATGSRAAAAGLRVADRLYEISGNQWHSDRQLSHWLNHLPTPLPLLVERNGCLEVVVLKDKPTPPVFFAPQHNLK
ncbi:MAG: hypothetical protein CMJ75_08470 [Planctomycetaceae bacterium]|nr:hypothetical protein [Planctomycetaceae bacterium]